MLSPFIIDNAMVVADAKMSAVGFLCVSYAAVCVRLAEIMMKSAWMRTVINICNSDNIYRFRRIAMNFREQKLFY